MITLDQVLLLQEKVEAAVKKINSLAEKNSRLEQENASLREKCANLEKTVSEKTDQVSTMEVDQARIEESILNTLYRLDFIENGLLGNQDVTSSNQENSKVLSKETKPVEDTVSKTVVVEKHKTEAEKKVSSSPTTESVSKESKTSSEPVISSEDESELNGQFDIF